MHSSRMRTGRSLTVCCSLLPGGGCLLQGGSAPGGCLLQGGVCSWGVSANGGICSWGVCLLPGVSARGGVCSQGVCSRGSALGGVCSWGSIPACTEADTPPFVDRILDTHL